MLSTFLRLRHSAAACLLGGLVSLLGRPALAQAPASSYAGPRFPGGPDSLRAQVARQVRVANPAWVGVIFVRLDLDGTGTLTKANFLVPPAGTPAATLVRNQEVQALAEQLVQRLPRWQPGLALAPGQAALTTPTLRLPFGLPSVAEPLSYSEEYPTFAVPSRQPANPLGNVVSYLQRLVRYPAEDIRARRQGTVYAYFEVSETGAVEHPQIVGSLSPGLDAEVLRVLKLLPPALTPPRQQGRPVRVYYVLPLVFKVV